MAGCGDEGADEHLRDRRRPRFEVLKVELGLRLRKRWGCEEAAAREVVAMAGCGRAAPLCAPVNVCDRRPLGLGEGLVCSYGTGSLSAMVVQEHEHLKWKHRKTAAFNYYQIHSSYARATDSF